jgi:hypothetical protein
MTALNSSNASNSISSNQQLLKCCSRLQLLLLFLGSATSPPAPSTNQS